MHGNNCQGPEPLTPGTGSCEQLHNTNQDNFLPKLSIPDEQQSPGWKGKSEPDERNS